MQDSAASPPPQIGAASPLRDAALDVPSVDGFRGLAVLFILLGHCWNELGGRVPLDEGGIRNVFTSSYMGVDMLFIVSGFVLFLPVAANGTIGDRTSYALRRAARIVPAFYVGLAVSYLIAQIIGGRDIGVGGLVSHLLFLHGETLDFADHGFGVNGALWTMSVEVIFYAALPFVASWYRRHPFAGLAIAIGTTEVWHFFTTHVTAVVDVAPANLKDVQIRMALAFPSYITHFAIGMTGAWLYIRLRDHRRLVEPHAVLAQTAAVLGALSVMYLRGWEGIRGDSGSLDHWTKTADRTFLFGALVLATALAPRAMQWPVRNTVSRLLGTVSYGTYLVHLPLIKLLIPVLGMDKGTTSNTDLLVLAAVVTPLSVGIGYFSYAVLEEPFRRWVRRMRRAKRPASIPPVVLAEARS